MKNKLSYRQPKSRWVGDKYLPLVFKTRMSFLPSLFNIRATDALTSGKMLKSITKRVPLLPNS